MGGFDRPRPSLRLPSNPRGLPGFEARGGILEHAPTSGPWLGKKTMADKKKIIGLSALVVGGILFMAWLAGLLHFGKIAPGLTPLAGPPPQGRVLVVQETEIPRELEVMGAVISKSLAQVSSQVPGRVAKIWVEAGSRVKRGTPW